MSKLETAGYRGWWPMREFCGKDNLGRKMYKEGFRNMVTGEFSCDPQKGWNGEPPKPTGDPLPASNSETYISNFERINWHEGTEEAEKTLLDSVREFDRNTYRKNFDQINWNI